MNDVSGSLKTTNGKAIHIPQPIPYWDRLETVFCIVGGVLGLMSRDWKWIVVASLWLVFWLWTAWREWRDFVNEIVFAGDDTVQFISRKEKRVVPLSQFVGIASASTTKRGRIGNVYQTALVPRKAFENAAVVQTQMVSFDRQPATLPENMTTLRQAIAALTGLRDFGDVGVAAGSEWCLRCHNHD
ncbi:hypothetical protein [Wielerella bovis]|uniref:hypothetical protein n=1 Tax=Wielerella bovis TaxID=2917790 RepID=UPI0020193903|nr:hypothetical protein [Wielerella bovis]MCG7656526.1 hypothetical protein [Wielerella bovis]MCG7658751.1 hypothetical protein [Wielerella bovis]